MAEWSEEQRQNAAKTCIQCDQHKPLAEFYRQGSGHTPRCAECIRGNRKRDRAEKGDHINSLRRAAEARRGIDARRDGHLWWKYRLRSADIATMVEEQGGCAVCGSETHAGKFWHVDHDHGCCPAPRGRGKTCGKCVRGVLCHRCNLMLGQAQDDKSRLLAAIAYLERAGV